MFCPLLRLQLERVTVRRHELTKLPVWKPAKPCTKHHVSTFLETMKTMGWKCSEYTEDEMLAIARSTAETSDASQSKGKLTAPTPATTTKKAATEKAAAEKAAAEKKAEEIAAAEKKKAEEIAAAEKKAAEKKKAEMAAAKKAAAEKKKAEEMAAAEKKKAEEMAAAEKKAAEMAAKKVAADNVAAPTVTAVVEDQQMPVEETADPCATSTKRARESEDVDQEEESAVTTRLMTIYKGKTEKLVQEMTNLEEQKSALDKTLARVRSEILHLNSLSRSLAVSLDAASSKRQKQ